MDQTNQSLDPTVTYTDPKDMKFRFKKDKLGVQRPTFELKNVPVPNVNGLLQVIKNRDTEAGKKDFILLSDVVFDTIRAAAAALVGDDEKITQDTFPFDKITWTAIANQTRAERATIAPEVWAAFSEDYLSVMPSVAGKTPEQLGNAITVYSKKFSIVKTNKELLGKLKDQLALYMENSPRADEFTDILELLLSKVDTFLNADDIQQVIGNL